VLAGDLAVFDARIAVHLAELAAEAQSVTAGAEAAWLAQMQAAESARRIEAGRPTGS
jgi:hypothetical protein